MSKTEFTIPEKGQPHIQIFSQVPKQYLHQTSPRKNVKHERSQSYGE